VGQTGRQFKARFKEHIHAIKGHKDTSMFAQHILNTGHAYGGTEDAMKILHKIEKGAHMNTLEKFYIYEISKQGIQINDTCTDIINPVFEILTKA
jgi:hypothetical protein